MLFNANDKIARIQSFPLVFIPRWVPVCMRVLYYAYVLATLLLLPFRAANVFLHSANPQFYIYVCGEDNNYKQSSDHLRAIIMLMTNIP